MAYSSCYPSLSIICSIAVSSYRKLELFFFFAEQYRKKGKEQQTRRKKRIQRREGSRSVPIRIVENGGSHFGPRWGL